VVLIIVVDRPFNHFVIIFHYYNTSRNLRFSCDSHSYIKLGGRGQKSGHLMRNSIMKATLKATENLNKAENKILWLYGHENTLEQCKISSL